MPSRRSVANAREVKRIPARMQHAKEAIRIRCLSGLYHLKRPPEGILTGYETGHLICQVSDRAILYVGPKISRSQNRDPGAPAPVCRSTNIFSHGQRPGTRNIHFAFPAATVYRQPPLLRSIRATANAQLSTPNIISPTRRQLCEDRCVGGNHEDLASSVRGEIRIGLCGSIALWPVFRCNQKDADARVW